ncbi:DUF2784 domain-containing protein [Desulfofustis glycolicus]|uniref:DUF2784 domain-containing protein n=1 Tax=Desulfofustis glycolicus DSM 9705 TaxID=1121409 RepID=A0A1M5XR93_9BACT|nr:DUF2784 domain-containing protein [Desulfofustis glycolicus]MCB2217844.1 DUF2784 domain-containing protein [Desulfobulbaceae bacterium]SHI02347.1 Protein of Unknown function [Desulfofustis glycolicus DSM 9705]
MLVRITADGVLLAHLAFILFVTLGGLLAFYRLRLALLHLPAAAWGVYIEISGGVCPLTSVEKRLRMAAGQAGYDGGFIEHWLLTIIYPTGLTREIQYVLAGGLIAINVAIYCCLLVRLQAKKSKNRRSL